MATDKKEDAKTGKARPFYARSRNGCVPCRQRRLKCDEGRPGCNNCITKGKECEYETRIPLRERRAQERSRPGEQALWSVQTPQDNQVAIKISAPKGKPARPVPYKQMVMSPEWKFVPWKSVDPFDSLPVDMRFKSKELLHHFYQAESQMEEGTKKASNSWYYSPWKSLDSDAYRTSVASAAHDPHLLRNVLLIASLHYAWNVGEMEEFEATFIFHKLESMRLINTWLSDNPPAQIVTLCVRYIATLCFIECCLGNFHVGTAHLEGLMTFLNVRWPRDRPLSIEDAIERELCDRYLIVAYNIAHSLKSRLVDYISSTPDIDPTIKQEDSKELGKLVRHWHASEAGNKGIGVRLKGIHVLPFFFALPTGTGLFAPIDVSQMLVYMRQITQMYNLRTSRGTPDTESNNDYDLWDNGGPSHLFLTVVNAHIDSLSDKPKPSMSDPNAILSQWSGFCVVVAMYLTSVLGCWNEGKTPEARLSRHTIELLVRDLDMSKTNAWATKGKSLDLWFWKLYTGVLALAHARADRPKQYFDDLQAALESFVRQWTQVTGISSWKRAREVLCTIVWPEYRGREYVAEQRWNEITLGEDL